jgi:hypothetical protein
LGVCPHFAAAIAKRKSEKPLEPAYFALPPLAAFLVAFFLAIAPPFPEDETLNARRQLMLPTKLNRRHHSSIRATPRP